MDTSYDTALTAQQPLGALWRRVLATAIDCFILMIAVQQIVTGPLGAEDFLSATTIEWNIVAINSAVAVGVVLAVFTIPLALFGQTLGKFIFKLEVYPNKPRPPLVWALRRSIWLVLAYVPGNLIFMAIILIASLTTMWRSPNRNSAADYFAGSTVVARANWSAGSTPHHGPENAILGR